MGYSRSHYQVWYDKEENRLKTWNNFSSTWDFRQQKHKLVWIGQLCSNQNDFYMNESGSICRKLYGKEKVYFTHEEIQNKETEASA